LNVLDPVGNESSSSKHCGPTSVDDLIAVSGEHFPYRLTIITKVSL